MYIVEKGLVTALFGTVGLTVAEGYTGYVTDIFLTITAVLSAFNAM